MHAENSANAGGTTILKRRSSRPPLFRLLPVHGRWGKARARTSEGSAATMTDFLRLSRKNRDRKPRTKVFSCY
ncbi:hypothetical protein VNO80_33047 [Phaseolus coccineus]|uniref:Uncharacterized protein n=1 Tax=Phaseolus coccineus TaxID=3886 RepID=A0AAN9KYX9_PHACN